jgi:hypothetical protein
LSSKYDRGYQLYTSPPGRSGRQQSASTPVDLLLIRPTPSETGLAVADVQILPSKQRLHDRGAC